MVGLKILLAALLGLAVVPFASRPESLPADSALIRDFRETRPSLESIVAMARQERGIERISTDFVRLNDNFSPSDGARRGRLPDARWAEYKRLFKLARVPNGIGFSKERVYFYKADIGFGGSGESKGFLWLARSTPISEDSGGSSFDRFRRIVAHWYLEHSGS